MDTFLKLSDCRQNIRSGHPSIPIPYNTLPGFFASLVGRVNFFRSAPLPDCAVKSPCKWEAAIRLANLLPAWLHQLSRKRHPPKSSSCLSWSPLGVTPVRVHPLMSLLHLAALAVLHLQILLLPHWNWSRPTSLRRFEVEHSLVTFFGIKKTSSCKLVAAISHTVPVFWGISRCLLSFLFASLAGLWSETSHSPRQ